MTANPCTQKQQTNAELEAEAEPITTITVKYKLHCDAPINVFPQRREPSRILTNNFVTCRTPCPGDDQ